MQVLYDSPPSLRFRDEDLLYESRESWSLYRIGDHYGIVLKERLPDRAEPYAIAVFDTEFTQGTLHRRAEVSDPLQKGSLLLSPFAYPFGEVLMHCMLAQGRGLMVHACAVADGDHGYLFAGNSTHGKSTMAHLWEGQGKVVNDDRVILRWRDERFWMYSMPRYGRYYDAPHDGVPLTKVFFLRHFSNNCASRVGNTAASTMLLTRSFPPLWDADGMRFTLDLLAQLVDSVPCYELGFVPDSRVLDFVRCVE